MSARTGHSLYVPIRRRPKGPAGGQFSPEGRPDDPPVDTDELLRQATDTAGAAADPEDAAASEAAEPADDATAIPLLRPRLPRQGQGRR